VVEETILQLSNPQISRGIVEAATYGRIEVATYIVNRQSCDPASRDEAIMQAAEYGHLDIVQMLRTHGTQPDEETLNIAAANGHLEVVRELLKTTSGSIKTLNVACIGGHLEVVKALAHIRKPSDILRIAASHGHLDIVKYAVSAGADPASYQPLCEAAGNGYLEIVRWLIAAGANPHDVEVMRQATLYDHLEVVLELISHTRDTSYALKAAAKYGKLDIVKALIQPDTDIDSLKTCYQSVIDYLNEYKKTLC
jgi:ankyrin repeat protein